MSNFFVDLTDKIESGIDFAKKSLDDLEKSDNPTEDDVREISRNFNLLETYFSAIDRDLKNFYSEMQSADVKFEESPFELFESLTEQYFDLKDQFAEIIREVQRNEMTQQAKGMGGAMGGLGGAEGDNSNVIDFDGPEGPGPSGGQPGGLI